MVTGVIDREYDNKHFLYTPNDIVENVFVLKDDEVYGGLRRAEIVV